MSVKIFLLKDYDSNMRRISITVFLLFALLVVGGLGGQSDNQKFPLSEDLNLLYDEPHDDVLGHQDGHDGPKKNLIGQPDGHDGPKKNLIGQPDGHDGLKKILIGQPDGHDGPKKILIGQPDGHDAPKKNLIGQPDGHDGPKKNLIGQPDGHDGPKKILIGQPDGHDGPKKNLIGQPDGHDGPKKNLIGQPDGHDGPKKKLIGQPDGHDGPKKNLIGQPDGHDGHKKILIGQPDGHDGPKKNLIGQPDGHEQSNNNNDDDDDDNEETPTMVDDNDDSFFRWMHWLDPKPRGKGMHHRTHFDLFEFDPFDREGSTDNGDDDDSSENNSSENQTPLVRCKRPICDTYLSCSMGPQTDSKGCPKCGCLEDPCQGVECETGYVCDAVQCPAGQPCSKLSATCVAKQCRGPSAMCANFCPLGYKLNEGGCSTCLCRDRELSAAIPTKFKDDEDDDEDDNDDVVVFDVDDDEDDVDDDDYMYASKEEEYDDEDEDEGVSYGVLFEFKRRQKCTCNENENCEIYEPDDENASPYLACKVIRKGLAYRLFPELYHKTSGWNSVAEKASDYSLKPKQCLASCHCVNDQGVKNAPIYTNPNNPNDITCAANVTLTSTIEMNFVIIGSDEVKDTGVEAMKKKIMKITYAPEDAVVILGVDYPLVRVRLGLGLESGDSDDTFNIGAPVKVIAKLLYSPANYDIPLALDLLKATDDLVVEFDLCKVKQKGPILVVSNEFNSTILPATPPPRPAPPTNVKVTVPPALTTPECFYVNGKKFCSPYDDLNDDDEEDEEKEEEEVDDGKYSSMEYVKYNPASRPIIISLLVAISGLIIAILVVLIAIIKKRCCSNGHQPLINNFATLQLDPDLFMHKKQDNKSGSETAILVEDDVLNRVKNDYVIA